MTTDDRLFKLLREATDARAPNGMEQSVLMALGEIDRRRAASSRLGAVAAAMIVLAAGVAAGSVMARTGVDILTGFGVSLIHLAGRPIAEAFQAYATVAHVMEIWMALARSLTDSGARAIVWITGGWRPSVVGPLAGVTFVSGYLLIRLLERRESRA